MSKKKKTKKKNSSNQASRRRAAVAAAEAATLRKQPTEIDGDVESGATDEDAAGSRWSPLLVGLLIFLLSTPAIFGPYGQKHGYTPDLHMAAYIQVGSLVVLSFFLLAILFSKRMKVDVPRSPLLLPLLLFYGWAMLSVLWADTKYEAVVDALDWSGAFLCALLVILLLREVKQIQLMLFFILISGLLMALLGIGQFLFGIDWVQQHVVPAATFSNKNMAGQYGVLTLPIALVFFLRSKQHWKIWFFAVVMALIMTYIFYTRSRGAWVGALTGVIALIGLVIYLKIKHDYHFFGDMPIKRVAFVASLALFFGLASLTPTRLGNIDKVMEASIGAKPKALSSRTGGEILRANTEGFDKSANRRLTMWGNSIPMFKEHFLIGVGLGNWTIHHAAYQSYYKPDLLLMRNQYHANAHNDYIEILCELGIIGFALFVWVIVSLFRVIRRLLLHDDAQYFVLAMPFIMAISGIAVNAVFSFPLKQPVPILMVMIYIAVLSNLYGKGVEGGRDYILPILPLPIRTAAAVVTILAAAGLFKLQYDWYHSEVHYRDSVISMKSQKYKKAYLAAKRAYALNPLRTNLLWTQATAMLQLGRKGFYNPAVEMLEKVAAARYYSSSTLLNLASAYHKIGRHQDAVKAISDLSRVQPIGFPVKYQHGILLINAGQYEEAIKQLETLHRYHYFLYKEASDDVNREEKKLEDPEYNNVGLLKRLKRDQKKEQKALAKVSKVLGQAKLVIQQRRKKATVGSAS